MITTENITITARVDWLHGLNSVKKRPDVIRIHIVSEGKEIMSCEVTKENHWQWSFQVPKCNKKGKLISYVLNMDEMPDYVYQVNRYHITCFHKSVELDGQGNVSGKFCGSADQYGIPVKHKPAAVVIGTNSGIWYVPKNCIRLN